MILMGSPSRASLPINRQAPINLPMEIMVGQLKT